MGFSHWLTNVLTLVKYLTVVNYLFLYQGQENVCHWLSTYIFSLRNYYNV